MKPPIEHSSEKYPKGSQEYEAYLLGMEIYCESGDVKAALEDSPFRHQPHHAKQHAAFKDGVLDAENDKLTQIGE